MKRLIVLCLCAVALFFTGCPTQDKSVEIPESKTPAVSAEHIEKDADGKAIWKLNIRSTSDEFKNEITNELAYQGPYIPDFNAIPLFIINKIIKKKDNSVSFYVVVIIVEKSPLRIANFTLKLANDDFIQVKGPGNDVIVHNRDNTIYYETNLAMLADKPFIDKLRTRKEKMAVRVQFTSGEYVDIDVPPLFFEWLKRI